MKARPRAVPDFAARARESARKAVRQPKKPAGLNLLTPELQRPQTRNGSPDDDFIYEAILRAYVTGRLPPGTRLPEVQLAGIFDVSRERVRRVLQRLAHERWLDIKPNRGAVVPRPTMEDAREVTQARIVMESGIIEQLLQSPRLIDREALRRHVAAEQAAKRARNAVRMTLLTTDFHMLIAGFLRNGWISRQLDALVLRSLVFVALYGDAASPACCGPDEHREIARRLLAGDLEQTRTAMIAHLRGLETFLDFRTERTLEVPLKRVFRPDAGA